MPTAQTLQIYFVMTYYEFLIVYLACGAPFAVYFYLQNRDRLETGQFWLKTILAFIFWIPISIQLFQNYFKSKKFSRIQFDSAGGSDSIESELFSLQRNLESLILKSKFELSLFEIREIFDRYVGLTIELSDANQQTAIPENEIFTITKVQNPEIASLCNQRRNLKRLSFHHKLASNDFSDLIAELHRQKKFSQEMCSLLLEFVLLVNDTEMQVEIEKLFTQIKQTSEDKFVNETEGKIWIPDQPRQLQTNPVTMSFQGMKVSKTLSSND